MQMHVHVVLLVLNVSCRMQEFGVVSYTLPAVPYRVQDPGPT